MTALFLIKCRFIGLFRSVQYGWPKSFIAPIFLAFSGSAVASSSIDATPFVTLDSTLIFKLGLVLGSILIAQAIIPIIKSALSLRRQRKTFKTYIRSHLANTLESFGKATYFEYEGGNPPEWYQYLQANNLGVTSVFEQIYYVIEKARKEKGYIPVVTYFGVDEHSLDHNNPIWEMSNPEVKFIFSYLITQQQISTSIKFQYEGWFFKLVESEDFEKRERWCKGLEKVMYDMAQHYKNCVDLKKLLDLA